ncbi:MAG TPA: amidohydrolase family protein [Allosphingosinicella sp.]|nr:amidohydrolase family protein [Allosphingosinicella sp.]
MIDAHAHLWRIGRNGCIWPPPGLAAIHRDFELAELRALSPADGVILVQSQEDPADTDWLLSLAGDPFVAGVVGWADLTSPDAFPAHPKLLGLRPMVQDREAGWFDNPAIDAGLTAMARRGLVLDALVRPRHLPALDRLAARHPDLTIVIDHAAKPEIADVGPWPDDMARLAVRPNVSCKLSGLLTEMRADEVEPIFATLWTAFGPDRLVWGSDWPVVTLAATYAQWLSLARRLVPAEHHPAVFDTNARRIYRAE